MKYIFTKYKSPGFTLIELLVVIAIISLLASVVLVALNASRIKARDVRRRADLKQLGTAINLYYDDNNALPRAGGWWATFINNPDSGWGAAFSSDLVPKYMSKVPADPTKAGVAGDYFYSNDASTDGRFTLCATLEQPLSTDAAIDTNHTLLGADSWPSTYNFCISQ